MLPFTKIFILILTFGLFSWWWHTNNYKWWKRQNVHSIYYRVM